MTTLDGILKVSHNAFCRSTQYAQTSDRGMEIVCDSCSFRYPENPELFLHVPPTQFPALHQYLNVQINITNNNNTVINNNTTTISDALHLDVQFNEIESIFESAELQRSGVQELNTQQRNAPDVLSEFEGVLEKQINPLMAHLQQLGLQQQTAAQKNENVFRQVLNFLNGLTQQQTPAPIVPEDMKGIKLILNRHFHDYTAREYATENSWVKLKDKLSPFGDIVMPIPLIKRGTTGWKDKVLTDSVLRRAAVMQKARDMPGNNPTLKSSRTN
ncbi:hypothetical protein BCR33DRAFT_851537 [Rhizoclosmatium globosum]|uniref:Uncharacterized protein n=1 Tax=Rhizoclosmatium globosum TaxID=329046 RepID=A0A1Y2C696_9FUNG|nr:hypothetical protein BCR33DRAFT_851537 [Rhizoclosmatium globosum]|eukprot:ORY42456.1 hypothetical protein BCR33DRAFT_851537 [Rhizoclosmatium globosum]